MNNIVTNGKTESLYYISVFVKNPLINPTLQNYILNKTNNIIWDKISVEIWDFVLEKTSFVFNLRRRITVYLNRSNKTLNLIHSQIKSQIDEKYWT